MEDVNLISWIALGAFINNMTQIWTIFNPPPPCVTQICPRPYALFSQNALRPSPSMCAVIYEWPICSTLQDWWEPVSESAVWVIFLIWGRGGGMISRIAQSQKCKHKINRKGRWFETLITKNVRREISNKKRKSRSTDMKERCYKQTHSRLSIKYL